MVSAETQAAPLCDHCGKARHGIEPQCRACNYPAAQWAPNVQLAARSEEIAALEERYRSARDKAKGAAVGLEILERVAQRTAAVVNLPVGLAHSLFTGEIPLYSPYEQQLKGRLRPPAEPENDRRRRAVGGLLYGSYAEEMVYAALSADGRGLSSYGPVHLELEEACVAYRSTVLEENSYSFMERHAITPGKPFPRGYLARWLDRGRLAVAKLAQSVKDDLHEEECGGLLLQSQGDRASDLFLEVHVYGTFNHQAVRSLALPGGAATDLLDKVRQVQMKALKERLDRSGVPWKGSMSLAWICGRAGCAVVITPEDTYMLEAGASEPPRPCSPGQLNNLRNLTSDLVRSAAGPYPFQDVQQKLDMAWRSQSALAMLLTALDAEHSSPLRSEAAGVAERLLANPEVCERVRWRLLGTPMPREADSEGIQLRGWARALVCEALGMRKLVAVAEEIWEGLAFGSSLGPERLASLRRICVLHGVFAEQIVSLREGRPANLEAWLQRVPVEERDLLEPADLNFLKVWSAAALCRVGAKEEIRSTPPHQEVSSRRRSR